MPGRREAAPASLMLWAQVRAGLIYYRRVPVVALLSLLLPIFLYAFFGFVFRSRGTLGGTTVATYALGSYGAFAVSTVMLFNFGISIAQQRGQKIDLLQRATPLPGYVAISGQVVLALIVSLVSLVVLFAYSFAVGGVRLPAETWLLLLVRLLLGALPMLGMGLTIGYAVEPAAAPPVINFIYLPMAFISGIFLPLAQLPDYVQKIATVLPLYHYGQLAWMTVGKGQEDAWTAMLWVAGWTAVFFALAIRAYRADERRKFS